VRSRRSGATPLNDDIDGSDIQIEARGNLSTLGSARVAVVYQYAEDFHHAPPRDRK
jgi:hypothetical protein